MQGLRTPPAAAATLAAAAAVLLGLGLEQASLAAAAREAHKLRSEEGCGLCFGNVCGSLNCDSSLQFKHQPPPPASTISPTMPLCKKKDPNLNECIKQAIMTAFPVVKSGIPEIGVPALDPLYFHRLQINNGEGALKVKFTFTDVNFTGLHHVRITKADLDLEKPELRLEGDLDRLKMDSLYAVDGQVLLLPITGSGPANFTLDNAHYSLDFGGQFVVKNGRRHWDVQSFKTGVFPGKLSIHLENLFNGDKTLGKQINQLLNENSAEVLAELLEPLKEGFDLSMGHITKRLFSKVAFDDIFLD